MATGSNGYSDFNDDDERRFLEILSLPIQQQPYMCGWVTSGVPCSLPVAGDQFAIHLRDYHGFVGSDKVKFRCDWVECGSVMNKESIVRHIAETHIQLRFSCDLCEAVFTRRHTLNGHVQKKHGTHPVHA